MKKSNNDSTTPNAIPGTDFLNTASYQNSCSQNKVSSAAVCSAWISFLEQTKVSNLKHPSTNRSTHYVTVSVMYTLKFLFYNQHLGYNFYSHPVTIFYRETAPSFDANKSPGKFTTHPNAIVTITVMS